MPDMRSCFNRYAGGTLVIRALSYGAPKNDAGPNAWPHLLGAGVPASARWLSAGVRSRVSVAC